MKDKINVAVLVFITLFISSSFIYAQNGMDHSKMNESNKKSCCPSDNVTSMGSKCGMDKDKMSSTMKNSIVRKGEIDVDAIDANKDGKVFQDAMDWNVISDEAGECPICGMTLKEISIADAKNNLEKNNFTVK